MAAEGEYPVGNAVFAQQFEAGGSGGLLSWRKVWRLAAGGGHFGKMPVRCTAKTVLSLLSRACGGPLRLKRMVAARDVEGIVACLQQVAHNRPPKSISTVGMATWMIEWSAKPLSFGWSSEALVGNAVYFCPTIWGWGQWQAPILEKSLETCCRGVAILGRCRSDAQQKLCCRFWAAPAADPFAWSEWWPPGMWKASSLAYSKRLTTAPYPRSWGLLQCCFSRRAMSIAWSDFSRERLRRVRRKKAAVVIHLHTPTSADLHLHTLTSADLHLHTHTSADLHLHTHTSADLHLHTLTSADLHLHTFTSADLHLHTLTSADLDLHTLTSADLHLHTLTSADLHLHTFTPSHLHTFRSTSSHPHTCRSTSSRPHTCWSTSSHLHTCRSTSSHPHICRSRSSHPHICRSRSSHPHICRSTSSHLHICRSPLALLSISLLRRGRCRRSATKRNPFARSGRQTSKTDVKLRFNLAHRNLFARNEPWTSKTEVKLRFNLAQRNTFARNEPWTSKTEVKVRFNLVHRNLFAGNGRWTSKTEVKLRF